MRLFLGVWLSPEQRRELGKMLVEWRRRYPDWRWTSPDNLHVTLKFLGEVQRDRLESLQASFTGCAQPMSRFQIRLGGMGTFPERGSPNILWMGLTAGETELQQLATLIEKAGTEMGFPWENRPFRPHLTLARAQSGAVAARPQEMAVQFSLQSYTAVDSFALIESRLTASGPYYHTVAEFPFGAWK